MTTAGDVEARCRAALEHLCRSGGPLGVAVSGGGDSMALLAMTATWAPAGVKVHAATVDHGLRAESVREAHLVARFCAARDIPHTVLALGDLSGPGNLSARAREARYGVLADWAARAGLSAVLLGHTMDDQAETVLMRLARGSGAEGLSAMAEARDWLGMRWVRPLLHARRADLRDWLKAERIDWADDPTNEDPGFDRIKARRALAALAPLGITAEGLCETASILGRQRQVLEAAMADLATRARQWGTLGEARLLRAPLREEPADTGLRLLADTLVEINPQPYRPRFRALEPLFSHLLGTATEARTLGGCLVLPAVHEVVICREPGAVAPPLALTGSDVIWDGRWIVSGGAGLHVGALGARGVLGLENAANYEGYPPPEPWAAAPRAVRETVPALYRGPDPDPATLVAVPHAEYVQDRTAPAVTVRPVRTAPEVRR